MPTSIPTMITIRNVTEQSASVEIMVFSVSFQLTRRLSATMQASTAPINTVSAVLTFRLMRTTTIAMIATKLIAAKASDGFFCAEVVCFSCEN